jgi:hypothetical protein
MNPARYKDEDYIDFLIASQRSFTCTEAARCDPADDQRRPAHDSVNRMLERLPQSTEALWEEAKPLVNFNAGVLILDDTTVDKPYANKIEYVTYHWSGKHHSVVKGINVITLLWSDGKALIPIDFRIYNAQKDGLTKNDHFSSMMKTAKERGFSVSYVLFDSWYSSLENLKTIREYGWHFFTRLKSNRLVNPDRTYNVPVSSIEIPPEGRIVHLKGFGMVKVFKTVSREGDVDYWATDDLGMNEEKRKELAGEAWGIELFHRGVKQCCGIERSIRRATKVFQPHMPFNKGFSQT